MAERLPILRRLAALTTVLTTVLVAAGACSSEDEHEASLPTGTDALAAAVRVEAFGCRSTASVGGGSFVAAELIITVAHVVAGSDRVEVLLADGTRVAADVVAIDSKGDLALLHAEAQVHPLALGMATRGDRGEFVTFRDGSAVAMDLRVQRSLELFDAEGIYDARQGYELAAEVLEGDSGSVMVVDGKAAGVIFARSSGHAERAFAIDIAEAADLLAVDDDERADTGACVPDRH